MVAPIRFLSGRQQQQKIGVEGSTQDQKVLEVVGRAGIGTTIFDPSVELEVRGDAIVSGIITASSITITGAGNTFADLRVTGVSTFDGSADFNSDIDVDGHTELDNLNVSGVSTFASDVDINASIDVDGHTELDNLNVSGVSTFASDVDINASVDIDGHTELDNLNVSGVSTFTSNVDINASIDVDGHTELDNLNVSGVSTFTSNVDINASVDIDGHTELDNLNVSGVSTFTSNVDINASVDIDGHTELDNLNVSGVSTFGSRIQPSVGSGTNSGIEWQNNPGGGTGDRAFIKYYVESGENTKLLIGIENEADDDLRLQATNSSFSGRLTVDDDLTVTNNFTVNGNTATFNANVDVNGSIDVSGHTELDNLNVSGVSTFNNNVGFSTNVDIDGHTELDDVNVSGVITATSLVIGTNGQLGLVGIATILDEDNMASDRDDALATQQSIKKYVDDQITAQDLDFADGIGGTGAVDLDSQTFTIAGTSNEIETSASGQTLTIGLPNNVTISQDLTVNRDVQINRNLNVDGNITIGGTTATLFTQTLQVADADLVLGVRTDAFGNDVSNDTTANHGGIAIASTEGTPLVVIVNPGAGETLPSTYKKIMWFKEGSFTGLGTDAWLSNYAIGIGSTQFPTGTRLAAGSVQFTENDLAVVRNINASGIITASNGFVGNLTGSATTAANLTRSVIAGNGLTGGGELTADRTLNVGVGTGITVNGNDIQLRNSDNLTDGTITKWDDGNGQLTDSLITETGTIVNVGSAITFFTSTGIISATAYFGSGGNLEDIIQSKLEGFTSKFKPHDSSITILGTPLRVVNLEIFDNSTVGLITAVGFGSTAQYYFNDVTAIGLTTDANVNTSGIITSSGGFEAINGAVFTGDGSGLTNLGSVAAGVTVSNNDVLEGTAAVLNFGEDINVSPISAGVVTFSLNNNQNFTGIVTISSFEVSGVSTFTGAIDANGDLDVDGHTELDNLNVSGVSTFTGAADFNGDIDVDGHIELDDVNVSGAITATTFTGNLAGTVNTAAQPNITSIGILTGLDVTGHTELDSVNVSGVSTFTGAADFNGDIDVDGHTELDNLNVSGVSTLTNVEIGASLYDSNNSTGSAGQLLSSVGSGISWTNTTTTASGQNILSVSSSDTYNLTSSDIVSGVATAGFVSSSVVMTGTGSVGIGTTNPQAKLHVVDEFILSTAGAASTQRISERAYTTDNGTLSWEGSAGQLFSISNNLTSGSIFSVNDVSGIPSIDVDADGTIQLAPFGATENVGIGKTNPSEKLDVVGDIQVGQATTTSTGWSIIRVKKAEGSGIIDFMDEGAGITTTTNPQYMVGRKFNERRDSLAIWRFVGSGNGGVGGHLTADALFQSSGDVYVSNNLGIGTTNPTSKLHVVGDITANGDLGIGTTNPQAKLDVVGDSILSGTVGIGTTNSSSGSRVTIDVGVGTDDIGLSVVSGFTTTYDGFQSGGLETIYRGLSIGNIVGGDYTTAVLQLNAINSSGYNNPWYLGAIATPESGRGGQFFIGHRDQAAPNNRAEVLRIGTDGQVGIGTTNPTSKLHVVGDARVTGVVTATSFSGSGANLTSIPNSALTNDSVSYGGVSLDLGQSDATPAFDLSDATAYPYTSLTGITTEILGDTTPQLGGNLDLNSKFITGTGGINVTGVVTATTFVGNLTGTVSNASGATGDFSIADKIIHTGDTDTAIRFPADDTFTVETAGSERLRITSGGNIGIGSTQPLVALDVAGNIKQEIHTPTMPVGLNDDIGVNWTKIEMGAGLERINSLLYLGNGIVLAGSGDSAGDGDIYRSTDFGLTFTKIEMGADLEQIYSLVYCGNGIVLAGSGSGTGDGDVYRSTDFGLTWTKIEMGAGLEFIFALVYCGNGIVLAGSGSGTGDGDVYRSTDFGLTWTKIEMGAGLEQIYSLVYCGNGIVLAGAGLSGNDGDVYRSTDFGLTFTKIEMGSGLERICSLEYCGNGIVLAGSGTGTGDGDVYRSTDFGLTFTKIEMGSGLESFESLEYCGNGIVLAGSTNSTNDGDIYRSTDFGLTWTKIEMGADLERVQSLVYCGNGIVLAGSGSGTGDGDIYRSDVGFSQATSLQGSITNI